MNAPIFITGTDTDVGKTYITRLMLESLNRAGIAAAGYKPVASGGEWIEGEMQNPDAAALLNASDPSLNLTYDQVNPYFFEIANAPHLLSRQAGIPIDFQRMREGAEALQKRSEQLVIEGAGGWFTPLSHERTFADWVVENRYPVIVVVGLKLGCINHALLTFRELERAGLSCLGWVANDLDEGDLEYKGGYVASIEALSDYPLLERIHYGEGSDDRPLFTRLLEQIDHTR